MKIRKFYLWSEDMTECFDLNKRTLFATDPQGLGNTFETEYQESESGRYYTNVKPKFDNIQLKIYFNASNSNGYQNFKDLADFISRQGLKPFVFEYDDGITDKYCEVIIRAMPKSQKGDDGVQAETFEFERQSYWYELIQETFAIKSGIAINNSFPLKFPFGFQGRHIYNEYTIKNDFFIDCPISIVISGNISNDINIWLKDIDTEEIVSEIKLSRGCVDGTVITIDPNTKKIIVEEDGVETNGYDLTDKTHESFLYLPYGEYILGANLADEDRGSIDLSIRRYLLD